MNSTNTPQKLEFQDKRGEETDKVKKNILENLVRNKIAIQIRARNVAINGGRQANGKGASFEGEK